MSYANNACAQASIVKDIFPGWPDAIPLNLEDVDGTLFFSADNGGNGHELWKSDGTETGTIMVKDLAPGSSDSNPSDFENVNGTLFFVAHTNASIQLWKSDGTAPGTVMLKDFGLFAPDRLTNVDGTLYFNAYDGISGGELWKSDGTIAGTVLVKDINPGNGNAFPGPITIMNGILFFAANDGVNGSELWKSDGTTAGTVMVKDIQAGSASGSPLFLTEMNGLLYFRADNGGGGGSTLWKSDGTAAGTMMVGASVTIPLYLTNVNGTLFFSARDYSIPGDQELWKSDGTAAGTVEVKDISIGDDSWPQDLINVDGTLFFTAEKPTTGRELWKSDGTAAGTVMVKDINPGSGGAALEEFGVFNDTLYFAAGDGAGGNNGKELWKSDGTAAGTVMVQDIYAGSFSSNPALLTASNGTLFFTASDSAHGEELWKLGPSSPPPPPDSAALEFVVGIDTAGAGDTVVLPIWVNHFDSITTFQGTISFDTNVLSVDTVIAPNLAVIPGFGIPGSGGVPNNAITFAWFDLSLMGVDLPDSTVIMEISFVVDSSPAVGFTPVLVDSAAIPLGFSNDPNASSLTEPQVSNGGIEILDTEPPTINCPASISQNTDPGICGAVVNFPPPTASDNQPGFVISQTGGPPSGAVFPAGISTVSFMVTDAAGNTDSCSFEVTVIDIEPPVVLTQDITVSLDSNSLAILDPMNVDNGSFDLCGIDSLSLDIDTLDCAAVGSPVIVTLTVTDLAGNSASNTATITVENDTTVSLSGTAVTELGNTVPGVIFDLSGDDGPQIQTDSSFHFLVSTCGSMNDIGADKTDDAATNNGVNIVDALAIRRHVLLLEPLNTPYKRIAADVNASSTINILDAFKVQQKVAHAITHFTNPVTGLEDAIWVFIPSDYVFPNPLNPFGFETRRFYTNPSPSTNQNFIGVKLGDVNNDWIPGQLKPGLSVGTIPNTKQN